jgi:hypothetical protein
MDTAIDVKGSAERSEAQMIRPSKCSRSIPFTR